MKKIIVFTVLVIPVINAVVLKFFGENRYDVPIYYQKGLEKEDCGISTDEVYRVDPFGSITEWEANFVIFVFNMGNEENYSTLSTKLTRMIGNKKHASKIQLVVLQDDSIDNPKEGDELGPVRVIELESSQIIDAAECKLLIFDQAISRSDIESAIVLMDWDKRIRGYYNASKEKDFDRLSAELDILEQNRMNSEKSN